MNLDQFGFFMNSLGVLPVNFLNAALKDDFDLKPDAEPMDSMVNCWLDCSSKACRA